MYSMGNCRRSTGRHVCICILLTGLFMPLVFADEVDVCVGTSSGKVLANQKQTFYMRVTLTGQPAADAAKRSPVNVALVLDRSGSMQGEKIEKAKQAAIDVIEQLRPDDIISVVAYDDTVNVLLPATRVTDHTAICAAIQSLYPGNATALFAGISKGAEEIRKFIDKNRINRIVLLSDGLANVGPSSTGALAELGTSFIAEGISVSTIGLGLDYNEDLMTALAQKSDGNHMFAEKAEDVGKAFAREFGDVLSVVAKSVDVTVHCAPGVRPVRALGREAVITGETAIAKLNQVYGNQTKYMLLELELSAGVAGTPMNVASVDVSYAGMPTNANRLSQHTSTVDVVDSPSMVASAENADVMTSVVHQLSVERNELACRLRDEGKLAESRQAFSDNAAYLDKNIKKYNARMLVPWFVDNSLAAEHYPTQNDESWTRMRKDMREQQFEIRQQMKK